MKRRNGKPALSRGSEGKDGRRNKSARKAQSLARSKGDPTPSSLLLSVDGKAVLTSDEKIKTLEWGLENSRQRLVEMIHVQAKIYSALEDLMCFYNRVTESDEGESYGWTFADIRRLEEIRALLMPYVRAVC